MNSPPGTAEDPAPVTEPVAMVLSRQARPGQEQAFEEVLHRLAGVVRAEHQGKWRHRVKPHSSIRSQRYRSSALHPQVVVHNGARSASGCWAGADPCCRPGPAARPVGHDGHEVPRRVCDREFGHTHSATSP